MVYLYCSKIPKNFSPETTAEKLKNFFKGKSNQEYIEDLKKKKDPMSSSESLYALLLLSKIIENDRIKLCGHACGLTLARNEAGKPYFVDSPLKFSISHSKGLVACALSICGEIGVDIENSAPTAERAKKIADRYFDTEEKEIIAKDPERFTEIWTQKEAIVKFFGKTFAETVKKQELYKNDLAFSLHSFAYCKSPVTLCTVKGYNKIIFCDFDC